MPSTLTSLIMSDPQSWPPILVARTDLGYILLDGYHRQEAAHQKGMRALTATVQAFPSENDLVEVAFRANLAHGLRASLRTRSDYAYWLHITYPGLPQKEIAVRAQIKPSTVSIAIARKERQQQQMAWQKEVLKQQAQEAHLSQALRTYTRSSLRLFEDISQTDETTVKWLIKEVVKTDGEKTKLYRVVHLIAQSLEDDLQELLGSGRAPQEHTNHRDQRRRRSKPRNLQE